MVLGLFTWVVAAWVAGVVAVGAAWVVWVAAGAAVEAAWVAAGACVGWLAGAVAGGACVVGAPAQDVTRKATIIRTESVIGDFPFNINLSSKG
jgi:hypothetical protein